MAQKQIRLSKNIFLYFLFSDTSFVYYDVPPAHLRFATSTATVSQSFNTSKRKTHTNTQLTSALRQKKTEVKKQQLCVLTAVSVHGSLELLKGKRRRNNYTL